MKKFVFQGDWYTTIELSTFDKELDNSKYSFRRKELNKGEYQLDINEVFDENPDLSSEQKNTIKHIQTESNQSIILTNLFSYLKEIVYPEYREYISEDEYPGTFPVLNTVKNLRNVIGLDHIVILRFGIEGYSYYNLMFETSLDEEHGIGFVMHKNQIIEHGEIGGLGYEKVAAHMGMEYEDYLKYQTNIQTPPTREYQLANKKYGKLKPWQMDVNSNRHYYLYSSKQDEKLIEFIESGQISMPKAFENIRPHMQRDNRTKLIDYFKSKGFK